MPLIRAIIWSFQEMNLVEPDTKHNFIGFTHYTNLFQSAEFWNTAWNTLIYTVFGVSGAFLIGLTTAMLLNEDFRGRSIIRALVISPWPVPYVVTCLVWMWMYDKQFGVVNDILLRLGIISEKIGWLNHPGFAMFSVLVTTIWKEFPFATIMILAGLQNIPQEQYDQARVDGANLIQIFRNVTLPALRSVTVIVLLLLIIWIFKRFSFIYILTGGGPSKSTETFIITTYNEAFDFLEFGKASALGVIMLIIVFIFTLIYLSVQERKAD
jgi:multiple sugar transport system permease protein